MASFKLTKLERNWIFYDVGNSAFTLLITTIMPIYFNSLAESAGLSSVDYLAYWGYAASIVTLVVAFMGPTFGTLADTRGFKRPIFLLFLVIGLAGCVLLGASSNWLIFLVIFVVAKIGYQASLIFYDSMLSDVTTHERMDMISSCGYAWGYIGSCAPFILSLALVLGGGAVGISMTLAMQLAFCITAAWWLIFTLPLLKSYEQKHYVERPKHAVRESFARLGRTFKNVKAEKKVFFFLLAFFFYIDGVYTIIDMATAYGTALGLDTTGLLLALLVTQIVAFPFAILFGRLAARYATANLYSRVFWYRCFRDLSRASVAILAPCGHGRHVPGRHPGALAFLFHTHHPAAAVRRIFRASGYLRQRRILHGHDPRQRRQPDHRRHQHRCRHDRHPLHRRHVFLPRDSAHQKLKNAQPLAMRS